MNDNYEYDNNPASEGFEPEQTYTPEGSYAAEQPYTAEPAYTEPAYTAPAYTPENTYTPEPPTGAYHYSGSSIPGNSQSYQAYGYQAQRSAYDAQTPNYGAYQGYGHTQRQNPMASYNVTPQSTQPKKKSSGKGIVAFAIICALIGGLGGGTAIGMALRGGNTSDEPVQRDTEPASTAYVEQQEPAEPPEEATTPAFNSTVIDVTTNSPETDMTPQDVYENYVNAVVAISNESTTNIFGQVTETASSGSGFIISSDGYIVTNNHVVTGAQKLTVIMTSGQEYEAQIIGADSENDVALIKIDATDLPTVSIGDSDSISVGQQVCAIGNPLGELTNTLTVGYVSALDREINENGTPINMFQTDCAINSGNSGGPIFDMHGNVIGITTAKYSSSGYGSSASIEGIGFCIPANDAMDIVGDLLQYGYVRGRAYLGITCQAISATVTQYYGLPVGIYVNTVEEGSCAETAGLQPGDIISAIGDTEVTSVTEFKALLKTYSPGDTAALTVYRDSASESMTIDVVFDERPGDTTTSQTTP